MKEILRKRDPPNEFSSEVLPNWKGNCVVIIGGGFSITSEQIDLVHAAHTDGRVRCIAVNDSYLLAPWADVQYAADVAWHEWHMQGIPRPGMTAEQVRNRWLDFAGQKCSIENSNGKRVHQVDVHILRNRDYPNNGWGLSRDPMALVTGKNSGFQALNLATLAGAKEIILIGFDGRPGSEKTHWFGDHVKPTPAAAYPLYRQAMMAAEKDLIELGVEVRNCSPGSSIDTFRKVDLVEVL